MRLIIPRRAKMKSVAFMELFPCRLGGCAWRSRGCAPICILALHLQLTAPALRSSGTGAERDSPAARPGAASLRRTTPRRKSPVPRKYLTSPKEVVDADSGLSKNGAQRSLSHISGMTRYGNFSTCLCVTPNFVTARPRTVERIAKMPQALNNIPILEPGEPSHYGILTGTSRSIEALPSGSVANAPGSGSPCSRHDSAILRTRPCAISAASVTLRPSATRPGTSGLVARKPPSSNGSIWSRIADSFIKVVSIWKPRPLDLERKGLDSGFDAPAAAVQFVHPAVSPAIQRFFTVRATARGSGSYGLTAAA